MYFQSKTLAALTTLFVVNGSYASSFDGNGKQTNVRDLQQWEICEECLVSSKIGETLSCVHTGWDVTENTLSCTNFASAGSTCTNGMYPTDVLTFDEINSDGEAVYRGTHYDQFFGDTDFTYVVTFSSNIYGEGLNIVEEGECLVYGPGPYVPVTIGCNCSPSDSPSSPPSLMPSNNDENGDNNECNLLCQLSDLLSDTSI